ncbi:hypothetical protein LSTR_LSTR006595 [Laodelphax striatellus]|uniref:Cytochrome P450 n=1 Tax=Laodelphax striatellus TaxID=195883 RepID=A0A482WZW9_LAOST|nr:hypothetical protein LSTR_LSTR006595 [Laodelphax striatellus]
MSTWELRLILIGIILLLVYLRYRRSRKRFLELGAKLPGPFSLPVVGNILPFAMRPDDCMDIGMKFCTEFNNGPIRFWFLNELIVFVAKPQDIEILLSNMKHLRKPWQYQLLKDFMGEGLFTNSDNSMWRLHRKMITPAFHFSILKGFLPIFFEEANIFASKVLEEIDLVFGSDLSHTPTSEDLQKLEYLERVLKEVMRLYPSIPYFARVLEEEVTLSNYTLPKECIVCIFNYGLHRHPESFPNPDTFDPDNFLPERCRARSPFAFIPFSAGPRNCIGQKYAMLQMKAVVSTILRHFRLTPGKRFQNGGPIRIKATSTIKCLDSVDIVFHRR